MNPRTMKRLVAQHSKESICFSQYKFIDWHCCHLLYNSTAEDSYGTFKWQNSPSIKVLNWGNEPQKDLHTFMKLYHA
jgi:hypothetical protein